MSWRCHISKRKHAKAILLTELVMLTPPMSRERSEAVDKLWSFVTYYANVRDLLDDRSIAERLRKNGSVAGR